MPLQYPSSSPYNPYTEPKAPTNWPVIILSVIGVIVLTLLVIFWIIPTYFSDKAKDNNSEGILPINTYDCSSDVYNCGDFTTQAEAQEVFDYCSQQGAGDVHQLDRDGNGQACESLA